MKLLRKYIDKEGNGHVALLPEEQEDMWHIFNLIQEGDQLKSNTIRKVTTETATGTTSSQRVHTTLKIEIEKINFDSHSCALHLNGRNIEENAHVKMGAYHTLDLELNRKFTLYKHHWDSMHLERIEQACDPAQHSEVAAIVMQEGLAHICLLSPAMTSVRAKIDMSIPRKRKGYVGQHDKGMIRFFDIVAQAALKHINFDIVKCVLVASPGFIRDQFMEHLTNFARKQPNPKLIQENRAKFLLVRSSSGFKHAIKEILLDSSVSNRLADTKALSEVKALEQFNEMLSTDPARAYYGIGHVEKANQSLAIEILLLSDNLFRSLEITERSRYVRLVESVRDQGAMVHIFSSLHVSGEQLMQLSGVAAILRFPMPEIEEDDDEETDEE